MTPTVGRAVLIGAPAVIAGLWVGEMVYDRMPVETMCKVVYAFLAVAGVIALVG